MERRGTGADMPCDCLQQQCSGLELMLAPLMVYLLSL